MGRNGCFTTRASPRSICEMFISLWDRDAEACSNDSEDSLFLLLPTTVHPPPCCTSCVVFNATGCSNFRFLKRPIGIFRKEGKRDEKMVATGVFCCLHAPTVSDSARGSTSARVSNSKCTCERALPQLFLHTFTVYKLRGFPHPAPPTHVCGWV